MSVDDDRVLVRMPVARATAIRTEPQERGVA
jgi:hypothetical protein